MTLAPPLGILGGTFDPIHHGHLRPALDLVEQLGLQKMLLIPCRVPPHRPQPQASASQRLAMLQRAVASETCFRIDERELQRPGPSYMVDTLQSLREQYPDTPLCLCLGMDAFIGLPQWYHWQQIIELAHIVVSHRPGWQLDEQSMPTPLLDYLRTRQIQTPSELGQSLAGRLRLQEVTQLAIAATDLRQRIAAGRSARYLLPEAVWEYIQQQGLYSDAAG